jgi:hypothetical protein
MPTLGVLLRLCERFHWTLDYVENMDTFRLYEVIEVLNALGAQPNG